jgi:hypothetical protein
MVMIGQQIMLEGHLQQLRGYVEFGSTQVLLRMALQHNAVRILVLLAPILLVVRSVGGLESWMLLIHMGGMDFGTATIGDL